MCRARRAYLVSVQPVQDIELAMADLAAAAIEHALNLLSLPNQP